MFAYNKAKYLCPVILENFTFCNDDARRKPHCGLKPKTFSRKDTKYSSFTTARANCIVNYSTRSDGVVVYPIYTCIRSSGEERTKSFLHFSPSSRHYFLKEYFQSVNSGLLQKDKDSYL